ncbi:hypothetical protein PCANC_22029 [Puccinia coronata f. sp. avenae]|uniref:SAPS domain-containing protein n=1 Tax=Puccinia coronata f. sp. avenae TaxID=200324 RepID=A0A2N5S5G5_9BASI|nr:hypothetical protein PCANC_22029 [Puccinia coronata f. sp. avenae]
MAFWKFGFHSQSAIDSILSSSSANQHHANPNAGCPTPLLSNPGLLLDKLLEEDDLLQEIKAQHPKLIEFLGTREVVSRILSYVSGLIFDDEEADRIAENSNSTLNRLSSAHHPPPSSSNSPSSSSSSTAVMGYGGALLNSFRTRVVSDTIGALLMDALDSEGRTPEDRAKAERRKIRYPYLCTEILASDLWSVTSQIFSDFPRLNLLTRFWDAVLDQPPSATASKSVQIGYWAKANITLINSKPAEMMSFIRSYPNLIPKLLAHFNSSPIVDVLMRIIQSEQNSEGTIDWLIDSTDFVELIISLLHPSRSPDLHRTVAEFLKDLIAFCTNQVISNSPSITPKVSAAGPPSSGSDVDPDLQQPVPGSAGPNTQQPSDASEDHPRFITTRLMRELSSSSVVSKLLSFGLDTPISEDDDVITNATLASSLINSLSVVIDLIRRNNSDYSEHQLMVYLRDYPPPENAQDDDDDEEVSKNPKPLSDSAPRVVPLIGLLNAIGDRLGDLQALIQSPRSSIKPLPTVVGLSVPLTQERFRLIELYAELLHCSNMALVNRLDSEPRPHYNDDGALVSGLDALISIFGATSSGDQHHKLSDGCSPTTGVDSPEAADQGALVNEAEPPEAAADPSDVPTTTDPNEQEKSQSTTQQELAAGKKRPSSTTTITEEATAAVPAGVRMKQLFLEHKILDSCFDLFFDFPWNNLLHNVIYDLVQQTLNAKFNILQPSGLASLQLAQSFFRDTRIVDRLLDGVDANDASQSQSKSKNGRLGNMGHLILIGDEVLKAVESNAEELEEIVKELETNARWKAFVNGPVEEARAHCKLPLGGVMPVLTGILEPGLLAATDEVEDKLMATTSVTASGEESGLTMGVGMGMGMGVGMDEKVGTSAGGVLRKKEQSGEGRTKDGEDAAGGSNDDENDDEEENESTTRAAAAAAAERRERAARRDQELRHSDYDQDQWDSTRASDPSSFRDSRLADRAVISNPTPFGFDDRFDAPSRAFPQRFADADQSDYDPGGFDDDFGALQEAETQPQVVSTRGTPRPTAGSNNLSAGGSRHAPSPANHSASSPGPAAVAAADEDEWGEFTGPDPALPSPLTPADDAAEQERWNDFDLLVDRTNASSLNSLPSPSPPHTSSSS